MSKTTQPTKPHLISKSMWENLNKKVNGLLSSVNSINDLINSNKGDLDGRLKVITSQINALDSVVKRLETKVKDIVSSSKENSALISAFKSRLSLISEDVAGNNKHIESILMDVNAIAGDLLSTIETIGVLSSEVNSLKTGNPTDGEGKYMMASQSPGVPGLHLLGMVTLSDAQKFANDKSRTVFLLTGLSPVPEKEELTDSTSEDVLEEKE